MSGVFQPLASAHEPHTQDAAASLQKFLGPRPVEKTELVRQIRQFYEVKREVRELHNIVDNEVASSRVLALRCLEFIAKHHGGLHADDVSGPVVADKVLFAIARLLTLWWCAPLNSTGCERVFAMATLLSKKVCEQASVDDASFHRYMAVKHFGPDIDDAERPGGLFARVATELLKKERRHAKALAQQTVKKGKVIRPRLRAVRKDSGKKGQRKPYRLQRRLAERSKLLEAPTVAGMLSKDAMAGLIANGEGGDHPILHPPERKPKRQRHSNENSDNGKKQHDSVKGKKQHDSDKSKKQHDSDRSKQQHDSDNGKKQHGSDKSKKQHDGDKSKKAAKKAAPSSSSSSSSSESES